jgi:hypothetical protein
VPSPPKDMGDSGLRLMLVGLSACVKVKKQLPPGMQCALKPSFDVLSCPQQLDWLLDLFLQCKDIFLFWGLSYLSSKQMSRICFMYLLWGILSLLFEEAMSFDRLFFFVFHPLSGSQRTTGPIPMASACDFGERLRRLVTEKQRHLAPTSLQKLCNFQHI